MDSAVRPLAQAVFQNAGNPEVVACVPTEALRVLDVGCGAGDNARLLAERGHRVVGITLSAEEAALAGRWCEQVLVADVETDPLDLPAAGFDAVLLSHALEHLRGPRAALLRLAQLLKPGGTLVAAVPSMAHWRLRWRFLRGDWQREDTGPLYRTHLHFWSYDTFSALFESTPLRAVRRIAGGPAIQLWPARRLAPRLCAGLDGRLGHLVPNLAATQVIMVTRRDPRQGSIAPVIHCLPAGTSYL